MKVGQRLPDLVRTVTLTDMVAYGGATWDSHRLHYDHSFAVSAGMERPVVDGQMLGALKTDHQPDRGDHQQNIDHRNINLTVGIA